MWLSVANLPKGPLRDPNESGGRPVDNVGLSIQQLKEQRRARNWRIGFGAIESSI